MLAARFSDNVQGAFFILLASLLFATMGTIAKLLGQRLHAFEIAFARAFFGFLVILPMLIREGPSMVRTAVPGRHVARALVGSLGMMCGFYGFTHLSLADATAIGFSKPLFMILLAGWMLGESVRPRRWVVTGIGFFGVLVMMRPGQGAIEPAAFVALVGAAAGAMVAVLIKQLVVTERKSTILFYLTLVGTMVAAVPAAFVWITPTLGEIGLMVVMAAVGSLSQVCLMQGFKLGEASALAPFDYARLPVAALYGAMLFAELPDLSTYLGAAVIIVSTFVLARLENRRQRP